MRQEQMQRRKQRNQRAGEPDPEGTFPDLSYLEQRPSLETPDVLAKIDQALGEYGTQAASQ